MCVTVLETKHIVISNLTKCLQDVGSNISVQLINGGNGLNHIKMVAVLNILSSIMYLNGSLS